jgi:WD40 repeat protein
MRRFLLLLILCAILLPSRSTITAQENELAPYLYYYSSEYNAFVIERADGTDSRLFGDELMPPGTDYIEGPGWSPSGRWFAWSSSIMEGDCAMPGDLLPHAVYVDGTRRVETLDQFTDVGLSWSPVDDLLLAVDTSPGEHTIQTVAVIDVERDSLLISFELPFESISGAFPYQSSVYALWAVDGQHIIIYRSTSDHTDFWYFGIHGDYITTNLPYRILSISPAGTVVFRQGNHLVADNILTGESHSFDLPTDSGVDIIWDHTGERMIVQQSLDNNDQAELWLWIPEENVLELLDLQGYVVGYTDPWSLDDQQLMFWGSDGAFYVMDISTHRTQQITDRPPDTSLITNLSQFEWYWLNNEVVQVVRIYDGKAHYCLVQTSTGEQLGCVPFVHYNSRPGFSSDYRTTAYVYDEVMIRDLASGEECILPPNSKTFDMTVEGGEILWHDSDWFIIKDEATVAGGGGGYYTAVVRADGTDYRELDHAWYNEMDTNWLPPHVDPERLPLINYIPTLQPQPRTVLHGSFWPLYLSWSPDGKQIAVGWDQHDWVRPVSVWDIDTQWQYPVPDALFLLPVLWIPHNGNYRPIAGEEASFPILFSPDEREYMQEFVLTVRGGFWPYDTSYNREQQLLAVASSGIIRIWDANAGILRGELPVSSMALAFSPDGTQLAIVRSWNVEIYDVADLIGE